MGGLFRTLGASGVFFMLNFPHTEGAEQGPMSRRHLLAAAALLAAGCGHAGKDAELRFAGRPAPGAFAVDTREIFETCPACRQPVDRKDATCPRTRDGHPCGEPLRHPDRAACGFCRGTKICAVCEAFESKGFCRFCGGSGRRGTDVCFGCRGSGTCAACGGSAVCDACGGKAEIALPWARPKPAVPAKPAGSMTATRVELEPALVWLGEPVVLPRLPEEGARWTVSLAINGRRQDPERALQAARFAPRQPGSYIAVSGSRSVFFDVVDLELRTPVDPADNAPRRLAAEVSFNPALRDAVVRWEWVNPDGLVRRLEGPGLSLVPEGWGDHRAWPVVELPGVPARRGPRPAVLSSSALVIRSAPGGRVRCGAPVPFEATARPALPEGTPYEWIRTDPSGRNEVITVKDGPAGIPFPAPGKYRLQVRALGNLSPPVDLVAHRVTLAGPDGRALPEARLALLTGTAIPTEEWLLKSPERFRIVVEDPEPDPPASIAVSVRSWEGVEVLNPPVTYALSMLPGGGRETRLLALVSDPSDDAVALGGKPDDAADDPTLFACPRSRIEVSYRGAVSGVAGVGPMIVHEIPVRFVVAGPDLPPRPELEKILDRRLREAGAVWAPYGRTFSRASLETAPPIRNMLLIRGRGAGVDVHGRPSRAGARIDGTEVFTPTPWRGDSGAMIPATVARLFAQKVESTYTVDIHENLIASDKEAVVVRVRRRDGRPVTLEPLRDGHDVSQAVLPLGADLADGCEVTTDAGHLSLEELALLLGLRTGQAEGIDVILVSRLRSDAERGARFKYYPDDLFSAALAGAAIVSWEIADGSGRYPYALARVTGSLLLPPGWRPRPEDSLFDPELSVSAAADAHKRVGPVTGARIQERGRGLGAKNDDNIKGNEQGGR